MDAVAALRRARLVAAAACLGAAACGAAPAREGAEAPDGKGASDGAPTRGVGTPKRPPPGEIVTRGDPAAVHRKVAEALVFAGLDCQAHDDRVACKGDIEKGAAFYVVYREYPARLLFASPWLLKGKCDDALGAVNEFNWAYDELHVACDERGALVVSGTYFASEAGLTAHDVVAFARWWSLSEVRALGGSKLGPLLR